MKRAALVLLSAFLAAPATAGPPATEYWRPSEAQVAILESDLVLPKGSRPLAHYTRFYAGVPPKGSHRIEGLLLSGFDRPAGVRLVDRPGNWPIVNDGGCSVIHLTYDLSSRQVLEIYCNGLA